ncbi:MAG TPA: c-type cytochrome [Caulobacteraceae bacterium]|jgi:cbb3-type cytochrome c oxidase subunit III|nr:c-type cytochrome [Caulobacteraceae bacterium]
MSRASVGALALLALAAVVAAAGISWSYQRRADEARILALKADRLPEDPRLFAVARAAGAPLYARHCAGCHGADLKGDRDRGVPDMTDEDWLYGGGLMPDLEQTIRYGVRSGHPMAWNLTVMPAYGSASPHSVDADEKLPHLDDGEISDLADYLMKLEAQPFDAAGAVRGRALFHAKAICFDCHTDSARGDPSTGVPNVHDRTWLYGDGSKAATVRSIFEGRAGVCPAWIDKLGPLGVRQVAAYVKSRSKQSPFAIRAEDLTPPLPNEIPPPPPPPEA